MPSDERKVSDFPNNSTLYLRLCLQIRGTASENLGEIVTARQSHRRSSDGTAAKNKPFDLQIVQVNAIYKKTYGNNPTRRRTSRTNRRCFRINQSFVALQ